MKVATVPAVVAVSGIRELDEESHPDVALAICELLGDGVRELRFGGALGADTVALEAAGANRRARVKLRVFVPARERDVPLRAREAVSRCADEVVELGRSPRDRGAYLLRNDALLSGADELLAFTDGRATGGTAYTILRAQELGIPVSVVWVRGTGTTKARRSNPEILLRSALAPVHSLLPWEPGSKPVEAVLAIKAGNATQQQIKAFASRVVRYVKKDRELAECVAIVPMPRRRPGRPSDLLPVARLAAKELGIEVLEDWLVRVDEPTSPKVVLKGRPHFEAEEHARTMSVRGERPSGKVLLLDNVVTMSGTMVGAQQAIARDVRLVAPGLALLFSRSLDTA